MWKKIGVSVAVLLFALVGGAVLLKSGEQKPQTWPEALREYAGAPEYESLDTKKPLKAQTRVVELAGRTFEIPKVYIGSALAPGVAQLDGLILEFVLPEFRSKLDFPNRDAYKRAFKAGRFGHILIEPEAPRPSFDVMIENRSRNLIRDEIVGNHDGLEYHKWYRGTAEAPIHYYDMYLEKDGAGAITGFIECTPPARPGVRVPICSAKFRDNGLIYYVSYNRNNYFAAWQEQRRKAIAFVDSFETKAIPTNREVQ